MRSSHRSKWAARVVFVLMAAAVLGNMAWATLSSYKLAKKRVTDDYERRVTVAVSELNSYMAGVLNSETARDHRDYVRYHERISDAAYAEGGEELGPVRVLLPSRLATADPPYDWIDLYFQLGRNAADSDIELSSPQIDEGENIPVPVALREVRPETRQTWEWLKRSLPHPDRWAQVVGACARPTDVSSGGAAPESIAAETVVRRTDKALPTPDSEREKKKRSLRQAQMSHLPPPVCVDASIAEHNIRHSGAGTFRAGGGWSNEIEITPDPIAPPFWLGTGPNGSEKLAFVRECHWGDGVFYQGFVGDWSRLKPHLLAEIQDRFPLADLEPTFDDDDTGPGPFDADMMNLPVRLVVSGIPGGGASMAAWRSVRGSLIATWLAAVAVLVIAGWGLRNLVKLTERRMQFAYSVTHELRTPLTTFRLYSDMLSAGMVPEESRREYLDTLNRESLRLSKLVEGVLEYARLENQKVKLNPTQTDAASLLRAVSETLENRCKENDVTPQTRNAVANGASIRTDVDVVNRIVGVLVNNACLHARGRDGATVLLRLSADEARLHFDVIDSGPGIDRADARAIFKPFRRGRRADEKAQRGIGLGLALASSWAQLLGGRLTLAARHDPQLGGAHFRLTFPNHLTDSAV